MYPLRLCTAHLCGPSSPLCCSAVLSSLWTLDTTHGHYAESLQEAINSINLLSWKFDHASLYSLFFLLLLFYFVCVYVYIYIYTFLCCFEE